MARGGPGKSTQVLCVVLGVVALLRPFSPTTPQQELSGLLKVVGQEVAMLHFFFSPNEFFQLHFNDQPQEDNCAHMYIHYVTCKASKDKVFVSKMDK